MIKNLEAPIYVEGKEEYYFEKLAIFMDNYDINFHPEEGLSDHLTDGWDKHMSKSAPNQINSDLYLLEQKGFDTCGMYLKATDSPWYIPNL